MRVDKWLWAARFFKTRSLAARSCELGRVESRGQGVKPSRDVKVGDVLEISNASGRFEVRVLGLSEIRGPASVAQTLYFETEESKEARRKAAEERKSMPLLEVLSDGRPSKRDRRKLMQIRGRG
jgi:ribosome-associated heat shock protein Hsp15